MKRTFIKRSLVIIVAIVMTFSLFAFAGCNGDDAPATTTIRFVMPDGSPALAVAKLVEDGSMIDGEKIEIEVISPTMIGTEVGGEKADIAILPTNAAANIINKSGAYKIAATNVFGALHIVGVGTAETFDLNMLEGAIVACIGQGNTPEFVFKAILDNAGIPYEDSSEVVPGKVAIHFVGDGSGVIGALAADVATYGVIGEPAASVVGDKIDGATTLLDMQEEYMKVSESEETGYPQASLVIKTSLLEQRPEFVEKLLLALEANIQWLENDDNKAKAGDVLETVGSTASFTVDNIPRSNVRLKRATDIKLEIQNYLKDLFDITLGDEGFYTPAK